ncbi:hypothetical protein IGI67_001121 [Enterococcus sp. AZ196]
MPQYVCTRKLFRTKLYEVHQITCRDAPREADSFTVGTFSTCNQAIEYLEQNNPGSFKFHGCYFCCPSCYEHNLEFEIP